MNSNTTVNGIEFTRINNDVNGNPRYVCHFSSLLNDTDEEQIKQDFAASLSINPFKKLNFMYELAVSRAKKIGGKKYHAKQYGGGIVFQPYNIESLAQSIQKLTK